jgi:hypothetical protein
VRLTSTAVSARAYLAELPSLVEQPNAGTITATPHTVALSDVEKVWNLPDRPGERNFSRRGPTRYWLNLTP